MLSISTIKAGQAGALSKYYAAKVSAGELTPEQAAERQVADRAAEIAEVRGLSDADALALAKRERLMEAGLSATQGAGAYYKNSEDKPRLVWVKGGGPKGARVTDGELLAHLQGFTADGSRRLLDAHPKRLQALARQLGMSEDALMAGPALEAVRDGRHPESGAPLEGRAAEMARTAWAAEEYSDSQVTTYDLTFSAPKGLSILAGFGDEELREQIIGLHEQAADAAMEWAESADVFAVSRGHAREDALGATPLQTMRKTELSSRAGDPLIHSHVLMSAAAVGADGRRTTLDGRSIFHASRVIRSRYEATLATLVQQELGMTIQLNEAGVREVAGFDEAVLEQYSKRSAEVAEKLTELQRADRLLVDRVESDRFGYEEAASRRDAGVPLDPEQAKMAEDWDRYEQVLREWASGRVATSTRQKAALESRSSKAELSEREQLKEWAEAADRPNVFHLWSAAKEAAEDQPSVNVEGVIAQALARATTDASVIRQKDLVASLHEIWPAGWPLEQLPMVQQALMQSSELLQLTEDQALQPGAWTRGQGVEYTTRTAVAQESRIEAMAAMLAHSSEGPRLDPRVLAEHAARYTLTAEQEAFIAAAGRGTRLAVAEAPAGAGKTHTLSPLVAAYQKAGYEVVGVSTKADTAAALAEAGVNRHASLALLQKWQEEKTWQAGMSNAMALEGEACRTAVRQAETPAQQRAAEAELTAWHKRVAKEPQRLKAAWAYLKDDWAEFKAHPPTDPEARQQRFEQLTSRGEELSERSPKSWKDAEKTVLMLDEAAMTNNDQLEGVLRLAGQRGWSVVMTGDSRQLQGIGRSTGFGLVADAAGRMDISETYRARDEKERDLQVGWHDAESMVEGAPSEGAEAADQMVGYWREKGRLHLATAEDLEAAATERPDVRDPYSDVAIERIAKAYVADELTNPESTRLALARTNNQVNKLAEAIQREQIRCGIVDPEKRSATLRDQKRGLEQEIRAGETIRITKNVRKTSIRNGQVGVVKSVGIDGSIKVMLPTGVGGAMKTETIRQHHLQRGHAALGCASTGHGAQGRTVERAWVVADAAADREWMYPAMTRAKAGTDLHWVTDSPDRAEEEIRTSMLTTGAEASALQVSRTHPTPRQQAEAEQWLRAHGHQVTPEAIRDRASLVQAAEASKREEQKAALRVAQQSSAEMVQTIRQQRERKATQKQANQRQGRGMAA